RDPADQQSRPVREQTPDHRRFGGSGAQARYDRGGSRAGSGRGHQVSESPPLIEADRLTKRYGPVIALSEVTARVDGKIIGLLGPNGAGKSTLLKSLLGLVPYEGSARVLGLSAKTHGREIRD